MASRLRASWSRTAAAAPGSITSAPIRRGAAKAGAAGPWRQRRTGRGRTGTPSSSFSSAARTRPSWVSTSTSGTRRARWPSCRNGSTPSASAPSARTPMPTDPPCVILAGGQARRMGGGDKGLLPLGSGRVIDHVIARLAPQCGALAINANGDPARFADFGLPVLADPVPGQPGPLAGILAAMDWAAGLGAGVVVTAAADSPFLPRDLVARLVAATTHGGAVAESPDGTGRMRAHPTFGLWPIGLRGALADA